MLKAELLHSAYYEACMAELQALKPGNVHIFADGHGMTMTDFIKSAEVTAPIISQPDLSVGERILRSVKATQQAVGVNTNLGLILLCAPLIHAVIHGNPTQTLQQNLCDVLQALTVQDAESVAQAIVLAHPAGLGEVERHDVHTKPDVTLLEMMRSAQQQDRIAWQYAQAYEDVFAFVETYYMPAMEKWQNSAWATTALYLALLARLPDSHIVRKYGEEWAAEVMAEATLIEADYWATDNPKLVQHKLLHWDAVLKQRNINPGTSADLTVAALLTVLLQRHVTRGTSPN